MVFLSIFLSLNFLQVYPDRNKTEKNTTRHNINARGYEISLKNTNTSIADYRLIKTLMHGLISRIFYNIIHIIKNLIYSILLQMLGSF